VAITKTERLRRFYSLFAGEDQVLVVITADPDAIGSAMAVRRLLWRRVAGVTIASSNRVHRPDNVAMVRLLGVRLLHLNDVSPDRFHRLVLVDSQPGHCEAFDGLIFDAVIDHHPDTKPSAPLVDIRPQYGATSSILTEYLRAAHIKPSAKLATGLFMGIKVDTSNFENKALMEDVNAFQFLFRHVNKHLARRIEQTEIRPEYLKYFRKALTVKRSRKGKVFAHIGPVSSPDVLVLIADFFMKVNYVNWSIVSGISDSRLVVIFRNDGIRQHAGTVASRSFAAIGSAGGHRTMARAEIETGRLKGLVATRDEKRMLAWLINRVQKRATGK